MLAAIAERSYAKVTVDDVLLRTGASRATFYRHFANKEECFAVAAEGEVDRLADELLAAAREAETCREGLRRALVALYRFAERRPGALQTLVFYRHALPEHAQLKHQEAFGRLTRALDSARRENDSRHPSPPWFAETMVSATGFVVAQALMRGDAADLRATIRGLAHLFVLLSFDEEAAAAEIEVDWDELLA